MRTYCSIALASLTFAILTASQVLGFQVPEGTEVPQVNAGLLKSKLNRAVTEPNAMLAPAAQAMSTPQAQMMPTQSFSATGRRLPRGRFHS